MEACKSFDDNELSEWKNDGKASTAWIKYHKYSPVARLNALLQAAPTP